MNTIMQKTYAKLDAEKAEAVRAEAEAKGRAEAEYKDNVWIFTNRLPSSLQELGFKSYCRKTENGTLTSDLVSKGEFHYHRKADDKIYVFALTLTISKNGVYLEQTNTYTGRGYKDLNLEKDIDIQIGEFFLERMAVVDKQFVKPAKRPSIHPLFSLAKSMSLGGIGLLIWGVVGVLGFGMEGDVFRFLVRTGFALVFLALPVCVLAGLVAPASRTPGTAELYNGDEK